MFPFAQSVTPAVQSHLNAQVNFWNDLSKSLSQSFQQVVQANLELSQSIIADTMSAGQRLLTQPQQPGNLFNSAASATQPASEKLRAYQQQLSRVAADAQVELTRVTQQHVQETSRTAQALAEEVKRAATEQTQNSMRQGQDMMKKFGDPSQMMRAASTMQSAAQGSGANSAGNRQGATEPGSQQSGDKQPS